MESVTLHVLGGHSDNLPNVTDPKARNITPPSNYNYKAKVINEVKKWKNIML